MKKTSAMALCLLLALSSLSACAKSQKTNAALRSETNVPGNSESTKEICKIGVIQFADHPSLKNCYDGILEGLKEKGYVEGKNLELDYQVAQADSGLTNQIVQNFVSKQYRLIIAIATPAAMAAYNAAAPKNIPVVFSAVTDPIAAQLQNADGSNKKGISGTSDVLPIKQQLKMIRAFLPKAKTIGILYTTGESNSESSVKTYRALAADYGFEIISQAVNLPSDVAPAAQSLLGKVDCLSNLTDNTVVQNLQTILNKANAIKLPYFGSEEEQVANGCVAAEGLNYSNLGIQTGEMAAAILDGAAAESLPVTVIEKSSPFYNAKVLKMLGLELPDAYKDQITDIAR